MVVAVSQMGTSMGASSISRGTAATWLRFSMRMPRTSPIHMLPESPRKILRLLTFQYRKAMVAPARVEARMADVVSPMARARATSVSETTTLMPLARPSRPSMRFMELTKPRYQNRVNGQDQPPSATSPTRGSAMVSKRWPASMRPRMMASCPYSFFSAWMPKRSSPTPSARITRPAPIMIASHGHGSAMRKTK